MNTPPRHFAIVGAGMAGIVCARTLVQAGHRVSLFEQDAQVGGRMATQTSALGGFDHGCQYFTVRDARFERVLRDAAATPSALVRPWSATTVRVLDDLGYMLDAAPPPREPHFVAAPGMSALLQHWAQPLQEALHLSTQVMRLERDRLDNSRWQLRTQGWQGSQQVYSGFDAVLLALPSAPAHDLLSDSGVAAGWRERLQSVTMAPCWTLMLAFPQATQPGAVGPHWNAARSTHHRISWLARESSKPGRTPIERWTVQANPTWSSEHVHDDDQRVKAKLIKGFAQITGLRASPDYAQVHRWQHAQTQTPLGQPFLWNGELGLGLCGDWCLGHRLENAFVSGLELALRLATDAQ